MIKSELLITQCHLRFGFQVLKSLVEAGYSVLAGSERGKGKMSASVKGSQVITSPQSGELNGL
jgi:hypothetical protein